MYGISMGNHFYLICWNVTFANTPDNLPIYNSIYNTNFLQFFTIFTIAVYQPGYGGGGGGGGTGYGGGGI